MLTYPPQSWCTLVGCILTFSVQTFVEICKVQLFVQAIFARDMVHFYNCLVLGLGVLGISVLCFLSRKGIWYLRVLNSPCSILDASDMQHCGGGGGVLGGRKMIM